MSTLKVDALSSKTTDTDLAITADGSGLVDIETGFKVSGTAGVPTADIRADAITGAKIADDAIDSEHYVDGSIDTAHLAADAITGAKIADDAIDSEHYTDGSIDNAHIADDAIDSEHYADGSIDSAHLADDAITLAKMAGGTDGNLISYDTNGDVAAVATGDSGQVLTSNGAGTAPTFQAAAGGAWAVVASGTASTVTTLDFTSGFTAGKIQKIFIHDLIITAGRAWILRTSADGGSSYEDGGSDYTSSFTCVDHTTESHVSGSVNGNTLSMRVQGYGDTLSSATWSAVMEIVIQGHGDSGQYTTISWRMNFQDSSPNFNRAEGVGVRAADEVNDALRLTLDNTSGATFSCKYVHLELN